MFAEAPRPLSLSVRRPTVAIARPGGPAAADLLGCKQRRHPRPGGSFGEQSGPAMTSTSTPKYEVVDFAEIPPTACPCGQARRAFAEVADFPATIHRTEISEQAKLHYHKRLTETYYFLECDETAAMQLDGEVVHVRPGMCVLIRPGVRHRAIGRMTVLIVAMPKFDPEDEWLD